MCHSGLDCLPSPAGGGASMATPEAGAENQRSTFRLQSTAFGGCRGVEPLVSLPKDSGAAARTEKGLTPDSIDRIGCRARKEPESGAAGA